jgi:hypothetical protein
MAPLSGPETGSCARTAGSGWDAKCWRVEAAGAARFLAVAVLSGWLQERAVLSGWLQARAVLSGWLQERGVAGVCQGGVGSSAAQPSPSTGSATHGGPLTSPTAGAGHLGEGKISHRQRLDRARDGLLRYRSASRGIRSACKAMRYLRHLMTPSRIFIDLFHAGASVDHTC